VKNLHRPHLMSWKLHLHLILAQFDGKVVHYHPRDDVLNTIICAAVLQKHQSEMKQVIVFGGNNTLIWLLKKAKIFDAHHHNGFINDSTKRLFRVAIFRFLQNFITIFYRKVKKSRKILGKFSRIMLHFFEPNCNKLRCIVKRFELVD
jgi:hypothetical protein